MWTPHGPSFARLQYREKEDSQKIANLPVLVTCQSHWTLAMLSSKLTVLLLMVSAINDLYGA